MSAPGEVSATEAFASTHTLASLIVRMVLADGDVDTTFFTIPTETMAIFQFPVPSGKPGQLPASKSSIDAMPRKPVTGDGGVVECSICLEEIGVGGEIREMPCMHGFHSDCIVKWLKIHATCPICRYKMPVEDQEARQERRVSVRLASIESDPLASGHHPDRDGMDWSSTEFDSSADGMDWSSTNFDSSTDGMDWSRTEQDS